MSSTLVVGGAKGFGRAVVEAFCAEGHAVTLADVNEPSADEVVRSVPAGMPAPAASKAGIVNLVRALADELSPDGVRVKAIARDGSTPRSTTRHWAHQTDPEAARSKLKAAIPMRRQGGPADVVGVVRFLASESAAYVTGTSLVIDGGYLPREFLRRG